MSVDNPNNPSCTEVVEDEVLFNQPKSPGGKNLTFSTTISDPSEKRGNYTIKTPQTKSAKSAGPSSTYRSRSEMSWFSSNKMGRNVAKRGIPFQSC